MDQPVITSLPIMVVDDEAEVLKSIEVALRSAGLGEIVTCRDSREVIPLLSRMEMGIVLLDLIMPYVSGEELLNEIVEKFPEIPVIIVTANDEIDIAVKCMKSRAFDYIVKPLEKDRLITAVMRALELRKLRRENEILKNHMSTCLLERPEVFSEIVTANEKMLGLFQYVEAIAGSREPVLITGETGVGKELMARAVGMISLPEGPFVSVNVAGIDDNAFSDSLFGHSKGAFTGADSVRAGLVEKACGGTLFLDEIGDLNPGSQVKLLRLLQEHEYFPLGMDHARKSCARVIASTNKDLPALQSSGLFRRDLYYRISIHHLDIPPLRERLDDLPLLLDHFIEQAAHALGRRVPSYPAELITLLSNYSFPGNIRELRALVFDAVCRHTSGILSLQRFRLHLEKCRSLEKGAHAVGSSISGETSLSRLDSLPTLKEATRLLIREAMRRAENNQTMAARFLGISRQRLARHLKNSSTPS